VTSNPASSGTNRFELIIFTPVALPVKMLDFTAVKAANKKDILLTWFTGSEQNSDKFIVERSAATTVDFEEIGELQAAGNSTQVTNYSFNDNNAITRFAASKQVYYRLKQLDRGGHFTYSKEIAVILDPSAGNIQAYPNPVSDILTIKLDKSASGNVVIELYDMMGKKCKSITEYLTDGAAQIDVADLKTGVYFAKVFASSASPVTIQISKE
jgi:hypothetical protein